MEIKMEYLYHIKDEYFDIVNDENLMQTMEKEHILLSRIMIYYGLFQ